MLRTIVIRYATFDIWVMLIAGLFGFVAKEHDIPIPPLVLGIILGRSVENYFRQAAVMGFEKIVQHPICIVAILMGIAMLIFFNKHKDEVGED